METIHNNINTNDDNIIAIIDGVVYAKKPRGRPRNPERWRENGTHITGSLDKEYKCSWYKIKYKQKSICEYCDKDINYLDNVKRHQASEKCQLMKKTKELETSK